MDVRYGADDERALRHKEPPPPRRTRTADTASTNSPFAPPPPMPILPPKPFLHISHRILLAGLAEGGGEARWGDLVSHRKEREGSGFVNSFGDY